MRAAAARPPPSPPHPCHLPPLPVPTCLGGFYASMPSGKADAPLPLALSALPQQCQPAPGWPCEGAELGRPHVCLSHGGRPGQTRV